MTPDPAPRRLTVVPEGVPPATPLPVHRRLGQAFAALDAAGVRWCLLRGQHQLGEPAGDVDLLVDGDDLARADAAVVGLGFARLPRRSHPWHRFYLVRDRAGGGWLKLDLVTQLAYGRHPAVPSHLEPGCLDRARPVGSVRLLDPTDQFWTVALHCLLDKGFVSPRRVVELTELVTALARPSAGERHLAERLGPDAPDRIVAAVTASDWPALLAVGGHDGADAGPAAPAPGRRAPVLRRLRGVARPAYAALWSAGGMGREPASLDALGHGAAGPVLVLLRRAPGTQTLTVLHGDGDGDALAESLRATGLRPVGDRWVRLRPSGVEQVRVVPAKAWLPADVETAEVLAAGAALPGHPRCLVPGARHGLLLAARSLGSGRCAVDPRDLGQVSPATWREAEAAAPQWGVADELAALAATGDRR